MSKPQKRFEQESTRSRWQTLRLTSLISSCALVLAACSQPAEPIRIGATMSKTGAYATQGIAAANGYQLCEQHINASGGVLGRPIEFTILDDESSGAKAQELYQHLIVAEKVDAIMGPYGSTLTEAVAPITEEHRMVHISPLAATSSIWEQGRHHLFMVLPPAELFLVGLLDLAINAGYARVAILQEDALFPRAAGAGAASYAEQNGMQLTHQYTYSSGSKDFRAFLQAIAAADVEVLAMAASALDDFILVRQQLNALGIELKMFGNSGAVSQYQEALGEAAEGDLGLSAWEPSVPNPGAAEFIVDYRTQFNREPSFHAAGGYGGCQLLVNAIERAGSLNSDAIRDELLNLEINRYSGLFG